MTNGSEICFGLIEAMQCVYCISRVETKCCSSSFIHTHTHTHTHTHSGLLGRSGRGTHRPPRLHAHIQDPLQGRHRDHQQVRLRQERVSLFSLLAWPVSLACRVLVGGDGMWQHFNHLHATLNIRLQTRLPRGLPFFTQQPRSIGTA